MLDEKLRKILRDGALGTYMTNENGEFVPLDWSRSPDNLFDDHIAKIKAAFTDEQFCWQGFPPRPNQQKGKHNHDLT